MEKAKNFMTKFWNDEEGLQTLEIMLIIAVIVVIALLFRKNIMQWVNDLLNFGEGEVNKFKSNN